MALRHAGYRRCGTRCCRAAARRRPTQSNGSRAGEKEALRSQRTGSVIELLDAFEAVSVKFPAHRHLVVDAKAKALRLARYFWPGMLLSDYDWSESPY